MQLLRILINFTLKVHKNVIDLQLSFKDTLNYNVRCM
jgi:hypothetical protein